MLLLVTASNVLISHVPLTDVLLLLCVVLCSFCSEAVNFCLAFECDPTKGCFRFAALQSDTGQSLLRVSTADRQLAVVVS